MTQFEQFQHNVQTWAAERGIYEHSTALAQALKAVSEVGELADAVIKSDLEGLKDAIGDVAVCLVNLGHFYQHDWDVEYIYDDEKSDRPLSECAAAVSKVCGDLTAEVAGLEMTCATKGELLDMVMFSLYGTSLVAGLNFDHCCEHAWQQIKDRKGHMVAGGAFVKEGE